MSQLIKSLEKRIQQLKSSIDAQKAELAAYEHVLKMELKTGTTSAEGAHEGTPLEASLDVPASGANSSEVKPETPAKGVFSGNKTSMVSQIVASYGSQGTTPKEVDAYFTEKDIKRSKNLVYNTLSYLVAHGKLERREGKYFSIGAAGPARRGRKKKVAAEPVPEKPRSKRRISPEGLKRIKDAIQRRWAAKRAGEQSSAKPARVKRATKKQ